jgi:hypothetical protein
MSCPLINRETPADITQMILDMIDDMKNRHPKPDDGLWKERQSMRKLLTK